MIVIIILPAVFVTVIVNVSDGAIGLVEGIVSLDVVTVAMLRLRLDVVSVGVLHLVREIVFRIRLYKNGIY